MAVTNFYILTEEQYLKLLNGTAAHHTLDTEGWYHTDKIPVELIDDKNSTKKLVTAAQVYQWTVAASQQADWDETDSTLKTFIKNKPAIPLQDVLISDDGIHYTSVVNNNIANIDLSDYLTAVKTINNKSMAGIGNVTIDEIAFIDCRTSSQGQPTAPNTSGKLKIVLTTDATTPSIIEQDNYVYINLESSAGGN